MWTEYDLHQLDSKSISKKQAENQLVQFVKGFDHVKLVKPAMVGDGIIKVSHEEVDQYTDLYRKASIKVLKFVPASGAATRMFKVLFQFKEDRKKHKNEETIQRFFNNLDQFAFYEDLKEAVSNRFGKKIEEANKLEILDTLLGEGGMNYGGLPKGLLKFHRYENQIKTPAEEHLTEGIAYASKDEGLKIHFTVSPNHQQKFAQHVSDAISRDFPNEQISISYSTQKSYTDTIAVDLENNPFRDENGKLFFRPAGHGALLENLNEMDADLIFIKNIDNVIPDRLKEETIRYKEVLAGILQSYQKRTFDLLLKSDLGEDISKEGKALLIEMGFKGNIDDQRLRALLNRPIRVCGMVKNEGEPGGGPFWVDQNEKEMSLQIVEASQVNKKDEGQKAILMSSTHFNPVDLVCGVKNYKGEKFDLLEYRDPSQGFITEKSYQGRKLKAMELPGLWNGGMANWNTVFVEVPSITFNPVKTVMDLLKPNHQ